MGGEASDTVAAAVTARGFYEVVLPWPSTQQVVDIRWAALAAGRRLGRELEVTVLDDPRSEGVVITVSAIVAGSAEDDRA